MADEETTITIRVPTGLKTAVEAAAEARGMTLAGFVRQALQNELAPAAHVYRPPGVDEPFERFLKRLHDDGFRPEVVLAVSDQGGNRALYRGRIDGNLTSESLVAINIKSRSRPWVLLRRDVVGWFDGIPASLDQVTDFFQRQGWFPVTYPPR